MTCSLCKGTGRVTWHNGGYVGRGDFTSVERCHECAGTGSNTAERIATLTRERDEARAEVARLRALAPVDPLVQDPATTIRVLRERLALAYPRALQAAAEVVERRAEEADGNGYILLWAKLDSITADILALTPDDIERIAEEHEHG